MTEQTYEIHTNRELEFMLRRGKPLAHFVDDHPAEANEDIIPEEAFERASPHVGQVSKKTTATMKK